MQVAAVRLHRRHHPHEAIMPAVPTKTFVGKNKPINIKKPATTPKPKKGK